MAQSLTQHCRDIRQLPCQISRQGYITIHFSEHTVELVRRYGVNFFRVLTSNE